MKWFQTTRIVTHSGSFHPDDLLAVATLRAVLKKRGVSRVKLVRTREQSEIAKADFVVDVGGEYDPSHNRFDHHQAAGAGARANGIPYASFGLVWKAFGVELCGSEKVAAVIDGELVQVVDAIDNGVEICSSVIGDVHPYTFGHALSSFLPSWKELADTKVTADTAFAKALVFAEAVLTREIARAKDAEEGRANVEKAYRDAEDKRVVVLDQSYVWGDVLRVYPEPLYVIYPQGADKWHVKAVRNDPNSFKNRRDLPTTWAGKRDAEFAQLTGVADALFCHKNLFLAVAGSLEGAKKLAKLAI
ncbi:MAG: MYG1 family protein [Patescibacteria group bacterium]